MDYDEGDMARLEVIAEERGVSVASVIREAVKDYLKHGGRR